MKITMILVAVLLSSCAMKNGSKVEDFERVQNMAQQQWKENKENSQYKEYFNTWNKFNNDNKLDEKDGCYSFGRKSVELILILNRNGVVERAITQSEGKKEKCFVNSYTGVKFPAPPIAPFYHRMTMN
jgi:hypothetical protein